LAICPKCGSKVDTPIRTRSHLSNSTRFDARDLQPISVYECPDCKVRFRYAFKNELSFNETADLRNAVKKISGIRGELMRTLINLRGKINTLETERAGLMGEIMRLRSAADSRVETLENEVASLRNEVKSLRDLLGYKKEKACSN
jgi:uncharacterized protein YlaI